ncbi:50S ribosomal protein L23 [Candidatus Bathyarchaeota archaeon]|jgi:large subunit ribosomal protein L23|nr:50S ribosomal protein L23 [Candidatus Bathyarchaeota archaeon]MDP6049164.1 50S ribosomal protein L23 [Candidatus Bathyarchaeota archaeon]MDP7207627.1 50S ribosomal protein L23 [Candidatus Bathyarchaeota archaeon]MDP7443672.1 50S ribosomal protein L23 [Candidatus Bathyarchaeota archaeon]|tara:strand:+ start:1977 stop:2237 length:261 start_codon:yes stop_codon:yes gene_type:complete
MNPHDVILYPLMTERSVYMIENENKLVFIVNRNATKHDISKAVQSLYRVEVKSVNTLISRKSVKKAFVKLTESHNSSDLAIRLGIL